MLCLYSADKINLSANACALPRACSSWFAMTNEPVDERLARQVAAVAFADVRTVRRVLRGEPVRGFVGQRIREAVERLRRIQVARETQFRSPSR
jgi:hypothetical protein